MKPQKLIVMICLLVLTGLRGLLGQTHLYEVCGESGALPPPGSGTIVCSPRFTICCSKCAYEPIHLINDSEGGLRCTDTHTCDDCFGFMTPGTTLTCMGSAYFVWSVMPGGWTYTTFTNEAVAPPAYLFSPGGTYTFTLSIYAGGLFWTSDETITLPLDMFGPASFSWLPSPVCVGDAVTFTNTTPFYAGSTWNFGDPPSGLANTSLLDNPTHTYATPGTYTVTLETFSAGTDFCLDSVVQTITVESPKADFTFSGACDGDPVTFTNLSKCDDTWLWTFGDGTISSLKNPVHSYPGPGTYTVTLTINGGVSSSTQVVTIHPSPAPEITGPATTCVSATGTYTIASASFGSTYSWTALGGTFSSSSTGASVTVLWPFGYGDLIVTETNTWGCTGTDTFHVSLCCTRPGATNLPDGGSASGLIAASGGASTFTGVTFTVNGTWTVNANINWINCTVYLGRDAKIIIDPSRKLFISGGILQACGGFMWDGIYVQGTSARLEMVNAPRVQDALNAVVSVSGGVFDLTGAVFDLNHKAILVKPYAGSHLGRTTSCTFTCSNPSLMLYPHAGQRGWCGADIQQVGSITMGSAALCIYSGQLVFGILADKSNVTVVNNQFSSFTRLIDPATGFYVPETGIAIRARGNTGTLSPTAYTLSVGQNVTNFRNYFINCFEGIDAAQNLHVSVRGNTFTNTTFECVRLSNNNVRNILVQDNTMTNAWVGVHSLFNKGSGITIERNKITYPGTLIGTGIAVEGSTGSALLLPANVQILQNTIDMRGHGISVQSFRKVNITGNTITIVPPPAGPAFGIRVLGSRNTIVHNNQLNSSAPSNENMRGIFVENSPEATVTCNSLVRFGRHIIFSASCPNSVVGRNVMQHGKYGLVLQNTGLIGAQGDATHPSDNKWLGSWGGSNARTETGTVGGASPFYVRSGGAFTPTLTIGGGTPLGLFPSSGTPIMCPPLSGSGGAIALAAMLERIAYDSLTFSDFISQNRRLGKEYLYKALATDPALPTTYPVLGTWLLSEGVGYLPVNQMEEKVDDGTVEEASFAQTSLIPSHEHEAYQKAVAGIYLEQVPAGGGLTADQQMSLETIAAMCAIEGGQAVYQARALLNMLALLGPEVSLTPCGGVAPRMQEYPDQGNDAISRLSIYPNPVSEVLTIDGVLEQPGQADVFDLQGRKLDSFRLEPNQETQVIHINGIPQGLYLLQITEADNPIAVFRLVVVK